jgi:XTP/dITP diphosphohydrolase
MDLLLATRNAHKTREIQQILGPEFAVRDLSGSPGIAEPHESGQSFQENAILKAVAASRNLPGLVIADDSGLEVDALGGAPGIHSARYARANASDKEKVDKLLGELVKIGAKGNQRRARFRCVLALARRGRILGTFEGTVKGRIANGARGSHGFGYDPIFVPAGFNRTFAELPAEVKNRISHRANAIRTVVKKLVAFKPTD